MGKKKDKGFYHGEGKKTVVEYQGGRGMLIRNKQTICKHCGVEFWYPVDKPREYCDEYCIGG